MDDFFSYPRIVLKKDWQECYNVHPRLFDKPIMCNTLSFSSLFKNSNKNNFYAHAYNPYPNREYRIQRVTNV